MPKSKDIADYFEGKIADLRTNEKILFDIHLYFSANHHIMLWRAREELITDAFLEKYRSRGMEKFWVHRDDRAAFDAYMNPAVEEEAAIQVEKSQEVIAAVTEAICQEVKEVAKPPEAKVDEVAKLAQELVKEAAKPETLAAQAQTNQNLRAAVNKILNDVLDTILDGTRDTARKQINEMWKLGDIDPDLEHAVNVSTFSVIFAMAFGRIDAQLLADIALAGLLHDVGLSQISPFVVIKPWKSFQPDDLRTYAAHVSVGIGLIEMLAPETETRVKMLVSQHHEKFDGTGYPQRLDGFHVDDVAQLVAIADILDSFATGQWDGTVRTLKETFEMLEKLETARTFPEYFNPEVFAAVIRWVRSTAAEAARAGALEVVGKETMHVLGKNANSPVKPAAKAS